MSSNFIFPSCPGTDYTEIPNTLIDGPDGIASITHVGELKAILFIFRHTWGEQEYGKPIRLTLDEFCNGRKRKDGTRMGPGCGCAKNSIRKGIELAIEHGYITMTEDNTDKGRVQRYFKLNFQH